MSAGMRPRAISAVMATAGLTLVVLLASCSIDIGAVVGPADIVVSSEPTLLHRFPFDGSVEDTVGAASVVETSGASAVLYRVDELPASFSLSYWVSRSGSADTTSGATGLSLWAFLQEIDLSVDLGPLEFLAHVYSNWSTWSERFSVGATLRGRSFQHADTRVRPMLDQYHVVVSRDDIGTVRVYLNGRAVASGNPTTKVYSPSAVGPVWVVVEVENSEYPDYQTAVNDLRIYSGAIDVERALALFSEGPQ